MKKAFHTIVYDTVANEVLMSNIHKAYNIQRIVTNYISIPKPEELKEKKIRSYTFQVTNGVFTLATTYIDYKMFCLLRYGNCLPTILLGIEDIDFETKPRELKDIIFSIRDKYYTKISEIFKNITKPRVELIFDYNYLCNLPKQVVLTIGDSSYCKDYTKFSYVTLRCEGEMYGESNKLRFEYEEKGYICRYILDFSFVLPNTIHIIFIWQKVRDEKTIEKKENEYYYSCEEKKIVRKVINVKERAKYEEEFLSNPTIDNLAKVFEEDIKICYGILNNVVLLFTQYLLMVRDLVTEIISKIPYSDVCKELCRVVI